MGAAIQFFGKDSVIGAFSARDAGGWALLQGKQFLFKGTDVADLEGVLTMLEPAASAAVYTLRVYDDVPENEIKYKTDFDGSFNFRLTEPNYNSDRTESNYFNNRLSEIEARINGIADDVADNDIDVEEMPKSGIETLLKNPAVVALVPMLIEKLINFLSDANPRKEETGNGNRNGNIIENRSEKNITSGSEAASIARLSRVDKDFTENLSKLAGIAETKPELYKMLTDNLKNL